MIIEKKQIADLIPAPYNPRQSTAKQEKHLKESLEKFGMVEPIIFNKQTGYIVGGHFRVRELKKLGIKEIECVIVDLNEDDEKELNIRLNANTGSWDWDTLANDWDVAELEAWGLEIPQFDNEAEELEASEDDYDVPEGGIETDIVIGDLFEIGEHRLLCGDSTDASNVAFLFDGKLADMVMTDPPYNVDYSSKNKMLNYSDKGNKIQDDIENDKMDDNLFDNFIFEFYKNFKDITKEGGSWYVWSPPGNTETKFRNQWNESGLLLKQCLVWVKNNFVLGRQDYQWKHESCLYGWKEGAAHYFVDDRTKKTVIEDELDYKKLSKSELLNILKEMLSDKIKTSVLKIDKPMRNDLHPTMKPILLLAPLIENSSRVGEIVADGFLGSGSTMVAAHQLKRRCFGLELEPKYCAVIIDRMAKLDPSLKITRNGKEYKKTV
jgi:DNA modification methylase